MSNPFRRLCRASKNLLVLSIILLYTFIVAHLSAQAAMNSFYNPISRQFFKVVLGVKPPEGAGPFFDIDLPGINKEQDCKPQE